MVPPPVRATFTGFVKPSAPNAAAPVVPAAVMLRFAAVPECSVIAPVAALMVGITPVAALIFANKPPTVSVVLIWPAPATPVTNVNVVLLIVRVSPAEKLVVMESLGAVPDSRVAVVIGTGGDALFTAATPT